jgi:hypothetical protein
MMAGSSERQAIKENKERKKSILNAGWFMVRMILGKDIVFTSAFQP